MIYFNTTVEKEIRLQRSSDKYIDASNLWSDLNYKGVPYKNVSLNDVIGLGIHHFFDTKNNIRRNTTTSIMECIDYILNPQMTKLFVKKYLSYSKDEFEADYFLVEDSLRITESYSETNHKRIIGKSVIEKNLSTNISMIEFHHNVAEIARINFDQIVYPLYSKDYEKIENYLGGK